MPTTLYILVKTHWTFYVNNLQILTFSQITFREISRLNRTSPLRPAVAVTGVYLLVSSADIYANSLKPDQAWSGSKLFKTLMVFLKEFFKKVNLNKKSAGDKKIQIRPIKKKNRVGIKPGFYHKAQPGGLYEGGFWGFYGFYVGFINLKVYHNAHN